MTKQEFLDRLRQYLHGKVSPGQVVENLQFYEDYINTEIRKGATEEEVMVRLGDPRLLARTIVETQSGQSGESAGNRSESRRSMWYEEPEGRDDTWYEEPGGTWFGNEEEYQPYEQPGERRLRRLLKVPVWAWLILVLLVVMLVVSAVFSLLAALLPILLPVLLVLFAVKAFRDWIH